MKRRAVCCALAILASVSVSGAASACQQTTSYGSIARSWNDWSRMRPDHPLWTKAGSGGWWELYLSESDCLGGKVKKLCTYASDRDTVFRSQYCLPYLDYLNARVNSLKPSESPATTAKPIVTDRTQGEQPVAPRRLTAAPARPQPLIDNCLPDGSCFNAKLGNPNDYVVGTEQWAAAMCGMTHKDGSKLQASVSEFDCKNRMMQHSGILTSNSRTGNLFEPTGSRPSATQAQNRSVPQGRTCLSGWEGQVQCTKVRTFGSLVDLVCRNANQVNVEVQKCKIENNDCYWTTVRAGSEAMISNGLGDSYEVRGLRCLGRH